MKFNGVCSRFDQTNCSILPYFVIGRITSDHSAAISQENKTHGDIISLDIEENMNEGKTFEWFLYASHHFTNETFIGKADMDTFVYAEQLHHELPTIFTDFTYAGRIVDFIACGAFDHCPRGWSYMSGGFSFISKDLVKLITDPNNAFVRSHRSGFEDLMLGKWLFNASVPLNLHIWDYMHRILPQTPFIHPVKDIRRFHTLYHDYLNKYP